MDIFLEGPWVFGALGALLITMAAIVYGMTGTAASQIGVVVAVLVTVGLIVFERLWETPREQIATTANSLFDAVQENNLPEVLKLIDPAAIEMRADAETLMPQFKVENAGMTETRIELSGQPTPATATISTKKAIIKARHLKSGMTGAYFDTLDLELKRTGDRWLITGYTPSKNWRKDADKLDK